MKRDIDILGFFRLLDVSTERFYDIRYNDRNYRDYKNEEHIYHHEQNGEKTSPFIIFPA